MKEAQMAEYDSGSVLYSQHLVEFQTLDKWKRCENPRVGEYFVFKGNLSRAQAFTQCAATLSIERFKRCSRGDL